jgi:hypothetical protein
MPTVPVKPDPKHLHPTGRFADCVEYQVLPSEFVTNTPVLPFIHLDVDDTPNQLVGDDLVLADILLAVDDANPYTSTTVDLTAGNTGLQKAQNLYGALTSNPQLTSVAEISFVATGPTSYRVSIEWNQWIDYNNFLDQSGLTNGPISTSNNAGTAPATEEGMRFVYQLLNDDGSPLTYQRSVKPSLTADGTANTIKLNFAGELSGMLYTTIPGVVSTVLRDANIHKDIRLRYGLTNTVDCETSGVLFAETANIGIVGAATNLDQEWANNYDWDGSFSTTGTQKFMSVRPGSVRACLNRNEWIWVALWCHTYHEQEGEAGTFTYKYYLTADNGESQTYMMGATDGVWYLPIGGANIDIDLTGATYYEIEVGFDYSGTLGDVSNRKITEKIRIYLDGCCGDEIKEVYFVEPLGSLSALPVKRLSEKSVSQEYGQYYRPMECDDTTSIKRQSGGLSSYGHYNTKRVVCEFEDVRTPGNTAFVEAFRASRQHYILISDAPMTWQKILIEPGSIQTHVRGERIRVRFSYIEHVPMNVQSAY